MKPALHNYKQKRGWRSVLPVLPACLLPLALMGATVKPALDFGGLSRRLEEARGRAAEAREMRSFLAEFGAEGPPTEQFCQMQAALAARVPEGFEPTEFYEAALSAARGLELELETIVPNNSEDLGYAVGDLTIHEQRATLKGRVRAEALSRFLVAMHREGHPVSVHACKLHSLELEPGLFDFYLDLGVFFLAPPTVPDSEFSEDS